MNIVISREDGSARQTDKWTNGQTFAFLELLSEPKMQPEITAYYQRNLIPYISTYFISDNQVVFNLLRRF